jgi:anti-sigma-K factor RskA
MSGHVDHEMKQQIPAYLLGALEPAELADFQHHLDGCAECQAELRWLEPSTVQLAGSIEQIEPKPAMKRAVMDAVKRESGQTAPASAGTRPAGTRTADPDRPKSSKRRRWFTLPEPGSGFALAGAMALVAVVLVAGVAGYALNNGDAPAGGGAGQERVITGTSTDGSDAVLVQSGNSGMLRISNLQQPQGGKVYQAWIERDGDIEPTESLFLPRGDGTATTSVPDLEGVDSVYVSVEPVGGSPAPTTTPVIAVELRS